MKYTRLMGRSGLSAVSGYISCMWYFLKSYGQDIEGAITIKRWGRAFDKRWHSFFNNLRLAVFFCCSTSEGRQQNMALFKQSVISSGAIVCRYIGLAM